MKKQLVFVYGTLRKEGSNAHYLQNATYIEHRCYAEGQLYDTGCGYPALVLEKNKWVTGELYEVTTEELKRLDELEDFVENRADNLYDRIVVKIKTSVGDIEAIMYVMNAITNDFISIEDNDWIKYLHR
ncbi:gamma-glutamylcyclotransferase family protein [Fictibacillus sp. 18YEL24]|uniref:gamma-glutamylcyclotransferase family protein n=1 Tax=Fictibacillus sp. 18YEL24 TaxID=2745875 RepID=UPI0018CDD81A|nr:gamma-glutamylcyclotransferase family protein [Fictibacillus sp. 18YEL24]MBH0170017.1 gamma-glutamylcyclotransferase [Fictibacillus sp. 18YEL24]